MRVRLNTDRVVPGIAVQQSGDVVEIEDKEAYRLLERGAAEPVEIETAALQMPEHHDRPRPKKGR